MSMAVPRSWKIVFMCLFTSIKIEAEVHFACTLEGKKKDAKNQWKNCPGPV